jgi:hypothetical protein
LGIVGEKRPRTDDQIELVRHVAARLFQVHSAGNLDESTSAWEDVAVRALSNK